MFITIVRGDVAQENWSRLQQHYDRLVNSIPDGLLDTFLVQNTEQPTTWQILSIWQSEESYGTVRAQKKTEACELLFIEVEAVPERQSYQVRHARQRV
jgi:hypothetical protein